jgi:two-component system phosphate regulon sensor histidine kinase PhoR
VGSFTLCSRHAHALPSQSAKGGGISSQQTSGWAGPRDFVKNAAHELRTPVSAISSAIEVLQSGAKEDRDQRDRFLEHIERNTARLERLLDALLILARLQSGDEQPAVSRVPVEPILQHVMEGVTPHLGVSLEIEAPRGLEVSTNPRVLEQLLANLVANAAQHTDSGSIALVASKNDGHIAIEVRDTGHGLKPSDQALIDRELARHDAPELEGLGIGLTIVREAIRALGGEVEIGPRTGGGTTARVVLPMARDES